MSLKNLSKIFIIYSIIIILIPCLFVPNLINNSNYLSDNTENITKNITNKEFLWPIPGYTKISSAFGNRISPTIGASSYHQGIDIPAPAGTNLIACSNAIVTYVGFYGSAGYSIHLKANNIEFMYHHVSSNYIVKKGDFVLSRTNYRSSGSKICLQCKK